jgi:hypothetical protein
MSGRALPDPDRHCFPDHRLGMCLNNGYWALEAVGPDGGRTVWLALSGTDADRLPQGCNCHHCAGHEQLGSLPDQWTRKIHDVLSEHRWLPFPTCGRPTASGTPCRIGVPMAGAACHWHGGTR